MGGIQTSVGARRARQPGNHCPHPRTISAVVAGLERIVCEGCGHLSFVWHEDVSDYIDRERAPTWPITASGDPGYFAPAARFHIRSRYELFPVG